jgi:crotonobetainyl-CoA:carnitine CoA-transferase CaiB-like acyl-CoA transferase
MTEHALGGIRVLDLSRGIAGPLAAMLLADHGAEVVRPEPPAGDPDRFRPGHALWNRNKIGVVADPKTEAGAARLSKLLEGADLCVTSGHGTTDKAVDLDQARRSNPALVHLSVPPFLGLTPWAGGAESVALLSAMTGIALRQSSFDGGPIDPVFPYVLYLQAAWAAAAGVAALVERESCGHGQVVTVGGVHASMVASSSSLVIDPEAPDIVANFGPGGPAPMYSRYQCADGEWLFLATLTAKFQERALEVLGLTDVMQDERIGGHIEAMLLPANRSWVRKRFEEVFASKTRDEWLALLRAADVPTGPLLNRDEWMDSPVVSSIGMRVEVDDPTHGPAVIPGCPINLVETPWELRRPAPPVGSDEPIDWSPRPLPKDPPTERQGPLSGYRVLDLGTVLAGPYAGTLLAELGADVIKVEIPAGDSWRERGMPYIRGQRGVAIDLQSAEGKRVFQELVRTADVVVDNYRAGVLERLGIDYERLTPVKQDIISVSITGYGSQGPFSSEPAFDPLLQARSGMMTAQGGDSEPVLMTVPINDVTTAALAVLGSVLALFHRLRSGKGQAVWLSLAGTSVFAQSEELIRMPKRSRPLVGGRDFKGPGALDRYYETADGWVRVQAPDVTTLVGSGILHGAVPTDEAELSDRLAAACATMNRDELVACLTRAGVPAAPARKMSELIDDTQYQEWEVFNRLDRPGMSWVFAPGRYARFSRSQQHETLRPPGVGEHTAEVLAEVGLSTEEIDRLAAQGAVRIGSPMVFRPMAAYR